MIVNHWGPKFTELYGHVFPESYLCIDTEYTGHTEDKDLVVEIGHVLVEDRQIKDQFSVVLDWSNHAVVPDYWVRQTLRRIEMKMREAGHKWRVTYDVMQAEGIKPEDALKFYWELFRRVRERKIPFVAHNGYTAEERMLRGAFNGFMNRDFSFGDNELFDTGAIEKASRAYDSHDASLGNKAIWLPRAGESLRKYFTRVAGTRAKGVFWRLELCAERYNLWDRYGLNRGNHHTAGFDALVLHYLMEEFRSRIFHSNIVEDPTASAAALARMFEQETAKTKPRHEAEVRKQRERAEWEDAGPVVARRPVRRRGQRRV